MTPEQFYYWLQGLLEVGEPEKLNERQVQIIKDHLSINVLDPHNTEVMC